MDDRIKITFNGSRWVVSVQYSENSSIHCGTFHTEEDAIAHAKDPTVLKQLDRKPSALEDFLASDAFMMLVHGRMQ